MGRFNRLLGIWAALVVAIPVVGQVEGRGVPFELHNGYLILVKGSVGNLKNLLFVVDTGSYRSVVDERITQKLQLKRGGPIEEFAANHVVTMNRVMVPELSWGGAKVTALNALVFDLAPMSKQLGRRIDLLLGLDVLQQTSFQIDFKSPKILFGGYQEPENSVQFEPGVRYLVVESRIDGHSVKLLMDTGSDSLAVFADRLPNDARPTDSGKRGRDLSGTVPFTRIAARQLLLGNSEFCNPEVFLLPAMPESKKYDGAFGPRVLGASKIYFDFERMRFGWDERRLPTDREGSRNVGRGQLAVNHKCP
jgi:hypothetical protein